MASPAVAHGITDLVWGEFDPSDQPLQAWGDHIPGAKIFAYIAAIWLVVAGAALLWRRSRRSAAASLAILYGIFVLFPLSRFYWGRKFPRNERVQLLMVPWAARQRMIVAKPPAAFTVDSSLLRVPSLHCLTAVPSQYWPESVTSTRLKTFLAGLTWMVRVKGVPLLVYVAVPVPSLSTEVIVNV
jgi:hypothetical protein